MATKTKIIPTLTFGERLGIARKKPGLTQAQMASQLIVNGKSVSEATIARTLRLAHPTGGFVASKADARTG